MIKLICHSIIIITTCFLPIYITATVDSSAKEASKDFINVAKKAIPAVVSIKVKSLSNDQAQDIMDLFGDDIFKHFFGSPKKWGQQTPQQITGQGSGFIVSKEGYILTNSHVVNETTEINVILQDGREFDAKVIGQDPSTDVALIKIEADNLPYIELGDSDDLEIGQWVVAIGSPLGLQASLTVGVVSAKGRNNLDLANIEDFIQTDAAINRGNSGGPLLDLSSQVIGMNTAIVSSNGTGGYMGIGFAIPSSILKHIMNQLVSTGSVSRGFMGVVLQSLDKDLAQAFGLKQTQGALVADVSKGSPAEIAGLKKGDIILSYNKQPVSNIGSLRNAISLLAPQTRVSLNVMREGKTLEIPVQIGAYPSSESKTVQVSGNQLGFEVQNLTPEIARSLRFADEIGVVVTKVDPNSSAAWKGLKKGDLIQEVNQKQITSVNEFNDALNSTPNGKPVLMLVKQGESIRYISIKVG